MPEELITIKDLAKTLNLSERQTRRVVDNWIKANSVVPQNEPGKPYLLPKTQVEQILSSNPPTKMTERVPENLEQQVAEVIAILEKKFRRLSFQ